MTPEQKHSVIQAILTFISSILCAITASSCINSLTPDPSPKGRGVITLKAPTSPQRLITPLSFGEGLGVRLLSIRIKG